MTPPYIPPAERTPEGSAFPLPTTPGQLNYRLTHLIHDRFDPESKTRYDDRTVTLALSIVQQYMDEQIAVYGKKFGYDLCNEVMGVFACMEEEHDRREWKGTYEIQQARRRFYQTIVAPYEERKIEQNGDLPFAIQ